MLTLMPLNVVDLCSYGSGRNICDWIKTWNASGQKNKCGRVIAASHQATTECTRSLQKNLCVLIFFLGVVFYSVLFLLPFSFLRSYIFSVLCIPSLSLSRLSCLLYISLYFFVFFFFSTRYFPSFVSFLLCFSPFSSSVFSLPSFLPSFLPSSLSFFPCSGKLQLRECKVFGFLETPDLSLCSSFLVPKSDFQACVSSFLKLVNERGICLTRGPHALKQLQSKML